MNNGGDNGLDVLNSFMGDTATFTNIIIAGRGESRYMVRESKMFVKDEI